MTQFDLPTILGTDSGTDLLGFLNSWEPALLSCHSGASRPSYAVAGMIWINTSATPYLVKFFDGTDDITIASINITTNAVAFSIADATTSIAGLMSAADKTKIDGIAAGAQVNVNGIVTLTDGATPALNAADPNSTFLLTAAGDRTIAVPSSPPAYWKNITIGHFASGAARTLGLNTGAGGFRFGSDVAALTQTASGKWDYIGCKYNITATKWDVVAYSKGF